MPLHADLIRRRRNELGLSLRAVGRRLGLTGLTVGRIEAGSNHDELTLRTLARLADVLAVDIRQLFAGDEPPAAPADDRPDVRAAGALLAAADGPVALDTLADALETSLPETTALLEELGRALGPAGLRLARGPDGITIVPDVCRDTDRLERLLRGQHATHGLTILDASLLARVHAGTLDRDRMGNADQVALARLENAGMIDDGGLTDEVRYSLGLA